MIKKYFEDFERVIRGCQIISSYDIEFDERTPFTGFIKGRLYFVDNSLLSFREFLNTKLKNPRIKYKYHFYRNDQMIFRYDNVKHYTSIKTFPDHKHVINKGGREGISESSCPRIEVILQEILEHLEL